MPKQRITKEMVVDAAFEIARKGGMEHMIVKNIAEKLGCSVQPIYSYCTNMEGLRTEVEQKARQFLQAYLEAHSDPQDLFRSTGHAYLQLAKEEPHILSIFVLQKRANVSSLEDLYQLETNPQVAQRIAADLTISIETAKQLHMHMLIYTIGIGTIFSVTTPGIPLDEIYAQQEKAYETFLEQAIAGTKP
ncbi:TetR/AcrR family transcriptional regulator [Enterococcus casseliflavus]|uniref:TetR/AcrR family transcriptional regulator n=1 Tax=Enterococcus casseliflavus TaxID=37734 RepID=UPI0035CAD1D8